MNADVFPPFPFSEIVKAFATGEKLKPFALIQVESEDSLIFLQGAVTSHALLSGIPRPKGRKDSYDTLSLVPFSQAKERNYRVHHGGEAVRTMLVERQLRIPLKSFSDFFQGSGAELDGDISYNFSKEEYEEIVRAIVEDEIGQGEGANFLICRRCSGRIKSFSPLAALKVFSKLLAADYGSYWKYLLFDGERFLLGSTPERHLSVKAGRVTMNPISGTFRKSHPEFSTERLYQELCEFLHDPKEINELFMVLDEELKMMARICSKGGEVQGPYLKEMSRLIHTEYILSGETEMDVVDAFRESMFAATMTGSPLENAFNKIYEYEREPREFYSGALLLLGHDSEGREWCDSPILIRTLDIKPDGAFNASVGASLVRDSKPEEEFKETCSKLSAVLGSLVKASAPSCAPILSNLTKTQSAKVQALLLSRNAELSHFWTDPQYGSCAESPLRGRSIVIIDNEDDFTWMLRHIFERLGAEARIVRHSEFSPDSVSADLLLVGPGPGNPNDLSLPKMRRSVEWIKGFLSRRQPFLAVCLGHQLLAKTLGFEVARKASPSQGVQKVVSLFGARENVGFYNSFVPRDSKTVAPGVERSFDDGTQDVIALKGSHFMSFQFHPESALTERGVSILKEAAMHVLHR